MGADHQNDHWVTNLPDGTTDDVVRLLIDAGIIEDLGDRTARQRWKKPVTFGLAHGIRSGAIPIEVLQILVAEARKMLKGVKPTPDEELRKTVKEAFLNGPASALENEQLVPGEISKDLYTQNEQARKHDGGQIHDHETSG